MDLRTRVWGASRLLLLGIALLATYLVFAALAMQLALRAREVAVPDLRGRSVADASAALSEAGIGLRVDEARRLDPKVPAGHIVAQDPEPGTLIRPRRSVRVWVSAGARPTIVPAVVGESDRAAQIRLQQDGFEIAGIAEIRTAEFPAGTVVAQSPPPRSTGTRVRLLVNRGERGQTFVMPDLIGVNGDRAAELLRARGFRVAIVGAQPYPGVPAGVVIRQSPQAGFQIAPGEAISLEVSR
jgi:beta-lactam-binding protein with PASTA domain